MTGNLISRQGIGFLIAWPGIRLHWALPVLNMLPSLLTSGGAGGGRHMVTGLKCQTWQSSWISGVVDCRDHNPDGSTNVTNCRRIPLAAPASPLVDPEQPSWKPQVLSISTATLSCIHTGEIKLLRESSNSSNVLHWQPHMMTSTLCYVKQSSTNPQQSRMEPGANAWVPQTYPA